jgi:hypothetical protein
MISSRRIFYLMAFFILMTGCTPRATPVPTATPFPTATLPPTLTPTPTPVPNCPAANPTVSWTAPADFNGYPQAIQNYLNAGGAGEALKVLLHNASSINDQYGGVYLFDLTGDGDPETIVSILDPFSEQPIPGGMLLVYSCAARQVNLIYSDIESDPQPMTQIVKVDDLIGAKRGGQLATLSSSCGAHTCFDTLDVLGWNGQTLISLMSAPLSLPSAAFAFNRPAGESAYQIEVQGGTTNSIGAGPQRVERQIWKWNGAQYVQVSAELSPVEYRIHAVYEGDDAFKAGDYGKAIDWYSRVITDDSLKDWQVEAGFVKPHDRETLTAYARFRLLLIGLLRGDANARDQLDRLTADFPDGSPVHDTQQLALAFWNKYQEAQDIKAACAVADAYANDQYQIVDDLNLFGYANRTYTSDDICPIR